MNEDPAQLARQSAYLDTMRAQGRPARFAGFVACLLGVLVLVVGRFKLGGPSWMLWTGVAVIGLGWGLFVYALVRRLRWIRTHPFDPNAPEPHG